MKVITETDSLSAAGPYSLAIEKNQSLFLSGQIGIDKDLKLVEGGIKEEFKRIIENTKSIFKELDYQFLDIVSVKIYLIDLADFSELNKIYEECFSKPYPTRTTLQVAGIPLGASIEVEIVAVKEKSHCACSSYSE